MLSNLGEYGKTHPKNVSYEGTVPNWFVPRAGACVLKDAEHTGIILQIFFSSSIWKHLLACSDLHISFLQGVSVRNLGLQCQNSQPCCIIGLSFPGCTTSLREYCVSQAGCNAARTFQSTIQNEFQKSKLCSHFSIIKWSSISFVVVLTFLATVLARILGLKEPQKDISMIWKLIFWFWEIKSNQDWSWFNLHMI